MFMSERQFNAVFRLKDREYKTRFMRNVLSRSPSLTILAMAIAERPEDVFSSQIAEVCKQVQEKHNLRAAPNFDLYL